MKKQLLFVIVLAIFAGITTVNAQNCTPGPLAPVAGVPYNYSATISGSGYDGTGPFTWYVTTNPNLLSATGVVNNNAGEIIATGLGAYNSPINGANGITIEWTSQAILNATTTPYYLVIKYSQTNATCNAMNMKVWEIKPINKFLLAINSFSGAVGQSGVYCAADITDAVVTPGPSPTITYTYGSNTIYAEVTASNYAGSWTPSFQVSGLGTGQAVTSVTWDTSPTGTFANTTTLATGVYTSNSNATAAYDGSTKLYVKVVIANNYFENLTDASINIAVDGIIPATTPLNDVVSADDCSPEAAFGKNVGLTLKARPTMTPVTGSFITKTP
jgi:hypothetical protein